MDIPTFDVTVADEGIALEKALETGSYATTRVSVFHPDMLLSERIGREKYGMPDMSVRPLEYTTLWCWAALQRMGTGIGDFKAWEQRVMSVDKVQAVELDPTIPAPDTGSP